MTSLLAAVTQLWTSRAWNDLPSSFTFRFDDKPIELPYPSLFQLYHGTHTVTKEPVLVFLFDKVKNAEDISHGENLLFLARNTLKYGRILRHPYLLRVLEAVEVSSGIYIVTESARPLMLCDVTPDPSWGLYRIAGALNFLHESCKATHNIVSPFTVFVTEKDAQWCLSMFDCVHTATETVISQKLVNHPLYTLPPVAPHHVDGTPVIDRWRLGCLMSWSYEVADAAKSLETVSYPAFTGYVPKAPPRGSQLYYELLRPVVSKTQRAESLKNLLQKWSTFFDSHLVEMMLFFEEIHLKNDIEKLYFFQSLSEELKLLPCKTQFLQILPQIEKQRDSFRNLDVLSLSVLRIGEHIKACAPEDCHKPVYCKHIVPILVQLFKKPDRALRFQLLQNLHSFKAYLAVEQVQDIFHSVCLGFTDSVATLRDATLQSMICFVPKLIKHDDIDTALCQIIKVIRHDVEESIRANGLLCLKTIMTSSIVSRHLDAFLSCMLYSLKDPFVQCRSGALDVIRAAVTSHSSVLSVALIMAKLAPAVCVCCTEVDALVQATAFSTLEDMTREAKKMSLDTSTDVSPYPANDKHSSVPMCVPQKTSVAFLSPTPQYRPPPSIQCKVEALKIRTSIVSMFCGVLSMTYHTVGVVVQHMSNASKVVQLPYHSILLPTEPDCSRLPSHTPSLHNATNDLHYNSTSSLMNEDCDQFFDVQDPLVKESGFDTTSVCSRDTCSPKSGTTSVHVHHVTLLDDPFSFPATPECRETETLNELPLSPHASTTPTCKLKDINSSFWNHFDLNEEEHVVCSSNKKAVETIKEILASRKQKITRQ